MGFSTLNNPKHIYWVPSLVWPLPTITRHAGQTVSSSRNQRTNMSWKQKHDITGINWLYYIQITTTSICIYIYKLLNTWPKYLCRLSILSFVKYLLPRTCATGCHFRALSLLERSNKSCEKLGNQITLYHFNSEFTGFFSLHSKIISPSRLWLCVKNITNLFFASLVKQIFTAEGWKKKAIFW